MKYYTCFPKYKIHRVNTYVGESLLNLYGGFLGNKKELIRHLKNELEYMEYYFENNKDFIWSKKAIRKQLKGLEGEK